MMFSQKVHENNLIEGISVLCNVLERHSKREESRWTDPRPPCGTDVKHCDVTDLEGSDHSSSWGGGKLTHTASKERMKHLFSKMGIDFNTRVIVFPHTVPFN